MFNHSFACFEQNSNGSLLFNGVNGGFMPSKEEASRMIAALQAYIQSTSEDEIANHNNQIRWQQAIASVAHRTRRGSGYLYVMHSPLLAQYKIGASTDLKQRLCSIRSQIGDLEISIHQSFWSESVWKVESAFHVFFEEKRTQGEWFNLSPADISFITSIAGGVA